MGKHQKIYWNKREKNYIVILSFFCKISYYVSMLHLGMPFNNAA